jgi:hypothetical protein
MTRKKVSCVKHEAQLDLFRDQLTVLELQTDLSYGLLPTPDERTMLNFLKSKIGALDLKARHFLADMDLRFEREMGATFDQSRFLKGLFRRFCPIETAA